MPTNENVARITPWRRPRPAVDANKIRVRIQMVMPHDKNIRFKKHAENLALFGGMSHARPIPIPNSGSCNSFLRMNRALKQGRG